MIVHWIQTAVAGIVAVLASSSASNMWQTAQIIQHHEYQQQQRQREQQQDEQYGSYTKSSSPFQLKRFSTLPSRDVIRELQATKREKLIALFLSCEAPIVDDLVGQWNGILLDNNHWIMVCTFKFR
jgi:hypothetical protein